jgi:hypothetical protein
MAERVQDHIVSKDVVTQPVYLPADSPLPFARFVSGELRNLMLPASILWISAKNRQQTVHRVHHRRTAMRDFAKIPFEAGRG